ncbi:hypothetical protein F5B22DRAFT_630386 [Xylaria bambusicola]|uniref:uncharacterized protein n=1 Tax=Xylaria bambusicola TaxID=326684 RepID=UPI0020085051|nr:uncharacterized protein F5B22DRAFT_630386 [Xylaria bambusicola]KAI0503161.1 hypothetical protein F5B22DRAFT_630386 [Xylaria bambusicola]
MAGCARDVDLWGQACPGNEPIYCGGLSFTDSDTYIYPPSDDEKDEASRLARIQRYEECGRRYLQGKPLSILSASLRGPFDKASGWQNPWLPKVPSEHAQRKLVHQSQPSAASSITQHENSIQAESLSTEEDGTIQNGGVGDSMECHLPSPQSHQDLQFHNSPSHHERRSRIESWANDIHPVALEKDKFWAPGYDSIDRDAEPSQKRPAGKEWLKRRPAKKRRLPSSQSTGAASTPTPTPTARLRAKRNKASVFENRPANRSFEMTTPSSSPDRGPRDSPSASERQPLGSREEHGRLASSNKPIGGTDISAEPAASPRQEQAEEERRKEDNDEVEQDIEAEAKRPDPVEDNNQGQSPKQTCQNNEEFKENGDFEDCADDSFYYRARQMKQPTSPRISDITAADCSMKHIESKTPSPPEQEIAVILSPGTHTQGSSHVTPYEQSNANDIEHIMQPNRNPSSIAINDESGHIAVSTLQSNTNEFQFHEAMFKNCAVQVLTSDAGDALTVGIRQPLGDITTNKHASRLNARDNIPQTVSKANEARGITPEPFFDEGVTLIGETMDMDEPGAIEAPQTDIEQHFCPDFDLLAHYAISATDLANANQLSYSHDITSLSGTKDVANLAMAIAPQQEPAELHSITTEPCESPPVEMTDSADATEVTLSHLNEDLTLVVTDNESTPPEQQSPWTSPSKTNIQIPNANTGQDGGKLEKSPAQPVVKMFDSPALMSDSPAIHPSQQSPWAAETNELTNAPDVQGAIDVETALIMNVETPVKPLSPPLPGHQNVWAASPSAIPPILSNLCQMSPEPQFLESTVGEEAPILKGYPKTPIPQIPRQSTPDGEVSIRSFSNFNFPSPRQPSSCPPSVSACRGILRSKKSLTSNKTARRVSFAFEQEGDGYELSTNLRAPSPPPPAIVDLEEDTVDGRYRKHFDVMNRRLSTSQGMTPRCQRRLLPNASQREPESPQADAMAEAFRRADADATRGAYYMDNVAKGKKAEEKENEHPGQNHDGDERPQSPWQKTTAGVDDDDVAAVMGNLNEFLDVWDVDKEMDRNRNELGIEIGGHEMGMDMGRRDEVRLNDDVGALTGDGIW